MKIKYTAKPINMITTHTRVDRNLEKMAWDLYKMIDKRINTDEHVSLLKIESQILAILMYFRLED